MNCIGLLTPLVLLVVFLYYTKHEIIAALVILAMFKCLLFYIERSEANANRN